MNDCITTTKQSTTKPCAYFLGYTVYSTSHGICSPNVLYYVLLWLYSDGFYSCPSRFHHMRWANMHVYLKYHWTNPEEYGYMNYKMQLRTDSITWRNEAKQPRAYFLWNAICICIKTGAWNYHQHGTMRYSAIPTIENSIYINNGPRQSIEMPSPKCTQSEWDIELMFEDRLF